MTEKLKPYRFDFHYKLDGQKKKRLIYSDNKEWLQNW